LFAIVRIHNNLSALLRIAVPICSPVFSLIKAQTVVLDREFGGRFYSENDMAGKLHPLEVARQVTPGKYPDGDGLYLIVASPTSRNWSYRYWIGGKERWHGLGSLQDVSLKDARIKRDAARQEVRAGVDIVHTITDL
jgi:hypothetical protein